MELSKLTDADLDFFLEYFNEHPDEFIKDILGADPWGTQIDIVNSVFENKYTAVKTCNAIGKSFIAARIVVAYLVLHPGSIVVTTAPTWRQVTDVLWREIGTAIKTAKYKLTEKEATQAGLNLATDWYAVGLSTSRPENFFGYHADDILVVVDEAGGVDEAIFTGVDAITPNETAHVLLIGNPTNPGGKFYDAFNKKELGYNCFTVSAFQTPNFTDSGITDIETLLAVFTPPQGVSQSDHMKKVNAELGAKMNPIYRKALIAPSVIYGRYHEWGVDSPAWESLVLGEFPSQAEQALIPANLVRMAMNMYGTDEETGLSYAELSGWKIPDSVTMEYGLDIARFGSDQNVLYPRHGGFVEQPNVWNKKGDVQLDLMQTSDMVLNIINPLDDNVILNLDDTGLGNGVTDRLGQLNRESQLSGLPAHRYRLNNYVFGSKERMSEPERVKFADITSRLYWNLRSWFYNKQIALNFDQATFDELVGRRWGMTKDGKIKVESKDDYKKRTGGKSPDRSDALALAFASTGTVTPPEVTAPPSETRKIDIMLREKQMATETSRLQSRY